MYSLAIFIDSAYITFDLLSKSLPPIVLGLILAEVIVALNAVNKIASLSRPLTRFGHLSDRSGATFMMAFFSAASANSMLASYYNDGDIEKRELLLASLVNSFPATTMHWRSLLPVLVPLLGVTGIIYFCLLMLVGLIKTTIVILVGRLLLETKVYHPVIDETFERPSLKEALTIGIKASKNNVKKVVKMTSITMFLVAVLINLGAFDMLTSHLALLTNYLPLPAAGLGIIAAQFAGYIPAYTIAGGLMATGELTGKEVVVTLLVGNVITSVTRAIRWFVPSHVGIFGPRIGTELVFLSTGLRNVIMLFVAFAVMLVW